MTKIYKRFNWKNFRQVLENVCFCLANWCKIWLFAGELRPPQQVQVATYCGTQGVGCQVAPNHKRKVSYISSVFSARFLTIFSRFSKLFAIKTKSFVGWSPLILRQHKNGKTKTKQKHWALRNGLLSFLSYLQRLWYLMYFKNPEGRKNCVCARERRHRPRVQSHWCQTTTSLIFDARAIIAHVRAMTELPGLMISITLTGGALLGVNQGHIRILCLLLLLLFQFPDPTLSIIKALHHWSHQFSVLITDNLLEVVSFVGNSVL